MKSNLSLMAMAKYLCILILIFPTTALPADLRLSADTRPEAPPENGNRSDAAPNEFYPIDGVRLAGPTTGNFVDISVGTDRGWIMAASRGHANGSHMILTDMNDTVLFFNHMNRELIRGVANRKEYEFMRLRSTAEEWRAKIEESKEAGRIDSSTAEFLSKHYDWWVETVRSPAKKFDGRKFDALHAGPQGVSGEKFEGVNYIFNDGLFENLQKVVRENRVSILRVNLRQDGREKAQDQKIFSEILETAKEKGLRIGALDLSNAHWNAYIGGDSVVKVMERMQAAGLITPESRLLLTGFMREEEIPGRPQAFAYTGYEITPLIALRANERTEARLNRIVGSFPPMFMHELYNQTLIGWDASGRPNYRSPGVQECSTAFEGLTFN